MIYIIYVHIYRLLRWDSGKEFTCQLRRHKRCRFNPWVGKIPWRRAWQPTPVFLPEKSHGQRRLMGYSPWGSRELYMTEHMHTHTHTRVNIYIYAHSCKWWIRMKWFLYTGQRVIPSLSNRRQTYTYSGILLSHKKERKNVICMTWMDLEMIILSEVSQKEKDRYHILLVCGI